MPIFEESVGPEITNNEFTPEEEKQFWDEAWAWDSFNFSKYHKERTLVAYRIVRELGRMKGILKPTDTLIDGLAVFNEDQQKSAWEATISLLPDAPNGAKGGFLAIQRAEIPLLPPKKPAGLNGNYDPRKDARLSKYVKVMAKIASRLGISNTEKGRFGLRGLLDVLLCQELFPSPGELVSFEQQLVKESLQIVLESGTMDALDRLRDTYSISLPEAKALIDLTLECAQSLVTTQVDSQRALLLLDLDRVKRLAEGADELRVVLAAIKLKAELLNLKGVKMDDSLGSYIDAMKRVAERAEAIRSEDSIPLLTQQQEE